MWGWVYATVGGRKKVVVKVFNKRESAVPRNAVYVGRPSKWGNPFTMRGEGDRARVIAEFRQYLLNSPELLKQLGELKGKDLVCWCAPKACHADVLVEFVEKGGE